MDWKTQRHALINRIKTGANLYTSDTYVYRLTHSYDHQPRNFYVKTNIVPEVMDALIAYIQFEMSEIEMEHDTDQTEVISILKQFYNAQDSKRSKSVHIDLYYNWEKWCGATEEIQNIEPFHREGLKEALLKLHDESKNK